MVQLLLGIMREIIMNIKQIEYFVEVAKTKNYTKAAQKLYISQSAITKQIVLLEEELEVELFVRNNKGVQLTLAGEIFLKDAIEILNKIEKSQKKIESFKSGMTGHLNLGYVTGLERTSMIKAFDHFFHKYRDCYIEFDSQTSYLLQDKLLKDQLDLILTHRYLHHKEYENIALFQSPIMVFLPLNSKYADKKYFTKGELNELPIISSKRDLLHDDIQTMEIDHMLLQVMGHKGVTILPEFAIKYTQLQKYVMAIPVKDMKETIYAVYRKDNDNPLLKKMIEFFKEFHFLD